MKFAVVCRTTAGCDKVRAELWEQRRHPYSRYMVRDSWCFDIDPGESDEDDEWLISILKVHKDELTCIGPKLEGFPGFGETV